MQSGVGYIVCEANCDLCGHKWVAVVEVDTITLLSEMEYKEPGSIECPSCGNLTDNFEEVS